MPQRNSRPIVLAPNSVTDTLDATTSPPGSMTALTNLVPHPTTMNLFECRPASTQAADFTGFSTPAFVSLLKVVGNRAYGMIASARFTGRDEPFIYDIRAGTFLTITGQTVDNCPPSPSTFGEWTPPTADLIGSKMVVTHPGYNGAGGNYFGWFDLSDPNNVTWNAGNTAPYPLPFTPTAVKQFGGRAWFAVRGDVIFTDALEATVVQDASHVITLDNDVPVSALGALPLNNQLGGIIQSLIVFKGVTVMYQITGNPAPTLAESTLAKNALNVATGTFAPNSICTTPKGLAFVSPQGLRIINWQAQVSDPIGFAGRGVVAPFINAVVPSRIAAACNGDVLRISVQNGGQQSSPFQEWFFDLARVQWTGPHTFASSLIQPYSNTFLKTPVGVTGKLFVSDAVQSVSSVFTENGTALEWLAKTSLFPDSNEMAEHCIIETTVMLALSSGAIPYTIRMLDQEDEELDSVTIATAGDATIWGNFDWGDGSLWGGRISRLAPRQPPWTEPIVFQRACLEQSGRSATGVQVGIIRNRVETLGYLMQRAAG
jgi:hypothetical protein